MLIRIHGLRGSFYWDDLIKKFKELADGVPGMKLKQEDIVVSFVKEETTNLYLNDPIIVFLEPTESTYYRRFQPDDGAQAVFADSIGEIIFGILQEKQQRERLIKVIYKETDKNLLPWSSLYLQENLLKK